MDELNPGHDAPGSVRATTLDLLDDTHPEFIAKGGGLRRRTLRTVITTGTILVLLLGYGLLVADTATTTDLGARNLAPSLRHLFGTDWLGRDMLARTLAGLRYSLLVGVLAATISAALALVLTLIASTGRLGDLIVSWLIDLFLALPHLVLIILLAFVMGGGMRAVVIAVGVTHWPSLARVLRSRSLTVLTSDQVAIARALGRSRLAIARQHVAGQLLPQLGVGLVLLFPHAILHEAALSYLGLGPDPGSPAIGVLLSDAMRRLSTGAWWLAVLPGIALVIVVKLIDTLGNQLRSLTDPRSRHV